MPEGMPQRGRWHANGALDDRIPATAPTVDEESFRATLISQEAVLSTGRNLAVSWCLGNIFPNPQGPGGVIDAEQDAVNRARYELFRTELEHATRIWERHSRMNFVHLTPLDDRRKPSGGMCDTALEHVWFRAQTEGCNTTFQGVTNAGGDNEFDPAMASPENPDGSDRLLCIAWEFLESAKSQIPVYAQHESGHIVGLQHEHVRWDQAASFEGNCKIDNDPYVEWPSNWNLTPPDPWSVMGYGECEGSEPSEGVSPIDMLGAYYTFNWTERRVTDMTPQTGGRHQRLWAGDERPGLLWYIPFPDRLLEWRFDAQQPGPLSFQAIERCVGDESPCAPSDSGGHWHPIMGQFTGGSDALDVFMHGPDSATDVLLRNRRHEGLEGLEGLEGFERIDAPVPDRAIPVVGNFGEDGTRDQILWYRPGPASEVLWSFNADGSHENLAVDVDQDDWRIPITGHFRSRTHWTDILWFEPRSATIDTWTFNYDFAPLKSGAGSAELLGVTEGTEYLPIVGNFDGDNQTDIFWYAPGSAADWLWLSDGNQNIVLFDSYQFAVDGDYHPIVGDFDGDGDDDIVWYRAATEIAGGPSYAWYFDGPSVEVRVLSVIGDYVPYVEDFDGDGCTDILWYDSASPNATSALWRCVPGDKTFACDEQLPTPKVAYPIGFATGGY